MTIKPVNIENLEYILTRIWSGELEHDQGDFFCGTSCCLAGWDVALHHPEKYEEYILADDRCEIEESMGSFNDPWGWSKRNNNLTTAESDLLFAPEATKALHKAMLEALKAGRRLDVGIQSICTPPLSEYEDGRVTITLHDTVELKSFLGDFDEDDIHVR